MTPAERNPQDVARWMRDIRSQERRTLDRLARTILCCNYCGCALRLKGYSAPGGSPVTLATCPDCDAYDWRNDA